MTYSGISLPGVGKCWNGEKMKDREVLQTFSEWTLFVRWDLHMRLHYDINLSHHEHTFTWSIYIWLPKRETMVTISQDDGSWLGLDLSVPPSEEYDQQLHVCLSSLPATAPESSQSQPESLILWFTAESSVALYISSSPLFYVQLGVVPVVLGRPALILGSRMD